MKLLVTGNIGYITAEFIEEAFPECLFFFFGVFVFFWRDGTKVKSQEGLIGTPDAEDGGRIQRHFQDV